MYRSWNTWKDMHFTFQASIACVDSGGSRPSDKGWGGGGSSRPWDKGGGGGLKKIFRPFGPQFGPKIRGGGGAAPPLDLPTLVQRFRVSAMEARPWKSWNFIVQSGVESHGKLKFCLVVLLLQMTKQGQCKIERILIKQRERHRFWWTPDFVSVELFKVKKKT